MPCAEGLSEHAVILGLGLPYRGAQGHTPSPALVCLVEKGIFLCKVEVGWSWVHLVLTAGICAVLLEILY